MKEMTPYPASLGSGRSRMGRYTSSAGAGETVCATQAERVSFPTNCQPHPSSTPSLGVGAAPGPKLSTLLLAMFLITEHQH